jgi:hypothetical protein
MKQWTTQSSPGFDPDGKGLGFLLGRGGRENFEPGHFRFYFELKRTTQSGFQTEYFSSRKDSWNGRIKPKRSRPLSCSVAQEMLSGTIPAWITYLFCIRFHQVE